MDRNDENIVINSYIYWKVSKWVNIMKDRIGKTREKSRKNACKVIRTPIVCTIFLGILITILLLSSAASAGQILKVSSDRNSVFSPWTGDASRSSLSSDFKGYALLLGSDGMPVSGASIRFEIYSGSGALKATLNNITQQNGLATVSYDTYQNFSSSTDTDYGNWTIKAYLTGDPTVKGSINMSILAGGTAIDSHCETYCHETGTSNGYRPKSPYTAGYGSNTSRAVAAHIKSNHIDEACYLCHPGYAENSTRGRTGLGYTGDVHKNLQCDYCHGTWAYISRTGSSNGNGIPKMPSCYQCHPVYNNNLGIISTLANLTGGIGISVYSYNFDTKAPLAAHNGTDPGLIDSVPCIICHGPAHNNSKPDPAPANTNSITESSQCILCHGEKHFSGTSCTDCHTQDAHAIKKPNLDNCALCHSSYVTAVNNSMHNQTKNAGAPVCTNCHVNYDTDTGHNGFVVNESNTCRNCHVDGANGFKEAHTGSSDCTQCHFANTTRPFSRNASLYAHDHNLVVEHSYYDYNTSGGMPLAINGGTGAGMFPQYTCSLTCHATRNPEKVDKASSTWLNSSHANSRFGASDSKNNCALCKSPTNYNDTLKLSNPVIAEQDWDGIQCRVCHNLHNRSVSGISGYPVAFYNATASSYVNYSVYDKVSNNTELCEKCHQPGGSHDSKFAGTHKDTLGFTCTSCHMNASFSRGMHEFKVENTTSPATGCEVCHKSENHTFQFTSLHTDKADCLGCHDQMYTAANVTGYAVTSDGNYGVWNDSGIVTTWHLSHGSPATYKPHNISKDVKCDKCHGAKSVVTGLPIAPEIGSGTGCVVCHPNVSSPDLGLHSGLNGTSAVDEGDCRTCHFDVLTLAQMKPGYANYSNTYFCQDCHRAGGNNSEQYNITICQQI